MNPKIENIDDDDDVLIRVQNNDGVMVTFLTAPSSFFEITDRIDPLTIWLASDNVFIAINEDLLNEMIEDSIEKNSEIYEEMEAAFLPIVHVMKVGLEKVDSQIAQRRKKAET